MSFTWSLLVLTAAQNSAPAQSNQSPARASAPTTAFVNVSVIPMDREQVLSDQTVLVRDGQIAQIGPASQVKVPAGAVRVDGRDKFLLPGLGDMHAHFFAPEESRLTDWYVEPRLACYIANGVTTIRVMSEDWTDWNAPTELPKLAASGKMPGPRIYLSRGIHVSASDTLETRFAALRAEGYDFVSVISWHKSVDVAQSLERIVAAARRAGVRFAGGPSAKVSLDKAILTYGSIERLQGYLEQVALAKPDTTPLSILELDSLLGTGTGTPRVDQSKMLALAAATQRAGVWNVPSQAEAERTVTLWSGSTAAKESLALKIRRDLVKALHGAGAGLLLGTNAPAWGSDYGFGVHQELEALVTSGLTPYQALETGTRNVAAFLGTLDSTGTVTAGKRADLVLLTGNPLADIRHAARPAGVMVNGQWLSRTKLDAQLQVDACSGR